jgi:hypothetical protein
LLNDPKQKPFDQIADLGIAIRTIGGEQQLHIGLLYKIDASPALLLNLRHQLDLRNELPSDEYRWIQIDLHEINRRAIATLCRLIASKSQAVPFGFTYTGLYFTQIGDFISHGLGHGLTCATFVMAIFETYSIPLLRTGEWPRSLPADMLWQGRQVALVQQRSGAFIAQAVGQHIGEPRFHPEHVTAGAVNANRPLGYAEAEKLGRRIRADLIRSYKGKPP